MVGYGICSGSYHRRGMRGPNKKQHTLTPDGTFFVTLSNFTNQVVLQVGGIKRLSVGIFYFLVCLNIAINYRPLKIHWFQPFSTQHGGEFLTFRHPPTIVNLKDVYIYIYINILYRMTITLYIQKIMSGVQRQTKVTLENRTASELLALRLRAAAMSKL